MLRAECDVIVRVSMFFFFFKQKTAYEMRISDWSSDVCSSDLGRRAGDQQRLSFGGAQVKTLGEERSDRAPRHNDGTFGAERSAASDRDGRREIGRASGRERVCQYV